MDDNTKRRIRDNGKLLLSYCFLWLYIPHILMMGKKRDVIYSDVREMMSRQYTDCSSFSGLIFLLHTNRYFRNLFYHRLGPIKASLVSWLRPGASTLIIPDSTKIGPGCRLAHPFATVLNADSIGANFVVRNSTTIGKKDELKGGRPKIGDNVTVGANVTMIGDISIGNGAVIGAGSVVVKDVPANSIVAGNPARIITPPYKYLNNSVLQYLNHCKQLLCLVRRDRNGFYSTNQKFACNGL